MIRILYEANILYNSYDEISKFKHFMYFEMKFSFNFLLIKREIIDSNF